MGDVLDGGTFTLWRGGQEQEPGWKNFLTYDKIEIAVRWRELSCQLAADNIREQFSYHHRCEILKAKISDLVSMEGDIRRSLVHTDCILSVGLACVVLEEKHHTDSMQIQVA